VNEMLAKILSDELLAPWGRMLDQIAAIEQELLSGYRMSNSSINYDEEKKRWTAIVEVPGMTKKDIKIEVVDGILSVKAEKDDRKFASGFRIQQGVNASTVKAEVKDGLLTITFEAIRPAEHRIPIK
jgi:HSP20 family protein